MDAWGQDSEEKGMSLVSVQSSLIDEVMEKLSKKDSVHIESVDSASPVRAQASVGVYRRKAKGAFCRGILLRKMGFILPPREKSRLSLKDFVKLFVKAYIEMRLNARSAFLWKLYKTGKIDIGEYDKKMDFFVRLLKR